MHTSIPIEGALLMGCDASPGSATPTGGFQVCIESNDDAGVKRIYQALEPAGTIQMPLAPTFWSPLFGACTDRFGVAWIVGRVGAGMS